jgi:hypothetical protein
MGKSVKQKTRKKHLVVEIRGAISFVRLCKHLKLDFTNHS